MFEVFVILNFEWIDLLVLLKAQCFGKQFLIEKYAANP